MKQSIDPSPLQTIPLVYSQHHYDTRNNPPPLILTYHQSTNNDSPPLINGQQLLFSHHSRTNNHKGLIHIQGRINRVGKGGNVHGELNLHLLHDLDVLRSGNEGNGETLGSEATGTTHTVQVLVGLLGEVVVDDHVHLLHIDATAEQLRRHQNTVLEVFELLEVLETRLRRHVSRDARVAEVLLVEDAGELLRARAVADEDDDLVELQGVEEVDQLADLVLLAVIAPHHALPHQSSNRTAASRAGSGCCRPARSSAASRHSARRQLRPS